MRVKGNSPEPGAGAAAGIEDAQTRHAVLAQRIDRRADRLPHDGVRVCRMKGCCRRIVWSFTICITQVRIADVVVGAGDVFRGPKGDPVICPVALRGVVTLSR